MLQTPSEALLQRIIEVWCLLTGAFQKNKGSSSRLAGGYIDLMNSTEKVNHNKAVKLILKSYLSCLWQSDGHKSVLLNSSACHAHINSDVYYRQRILISKTVFQSLYFSVLSFVVVFVVSGSVAHTLWSPSVTGILMLQRCRAGQQGPRQMAWGLQGQQADMCDAAWLAWRLLTFLPRTPRRGIIRWDWTDLAAVLLQIRVRCFCAHQPLWRPGTLRPDRVCVQVLINV